MMMRDFSSTNGTATISNPDEPMYHEEMSLGAMIATGMSCAIIVCILFTCCSKQWDLYFTEKILSRRTLPNQYLNHDDNRSSDLSDIEDEWASSCIDDSSSDDSNIITRVRYFFCQNKKHFFLSTKVL